jgi:hypothetical protein
MSTRQGTFYKRRGITKLVKELLFSQGHKATKYSFVVCNCEIADPSGRALAGIVGSNPTGGMDVCLVQCLCCQVEIFATGRSLIQRSPTDWCVLECDQMKSQKPSTPAVNKWVEEGRTKKEREL